MENLAQFITYKAALGLSLSLVLINQSGAIAGTSSDKTEWLTQNLNQDKSNQPLIVLKALPAREDNRQKSQSIIVSCSNDSSHTIKLRPFMANRKLPSRQDLELALIEQKAKLAQETNSRLNGQVSTFIVGSENNNQDCTPRAYSRNIAHKNYTRQTALRTEQSNFSFMKQAEQRLLSSTLPKINEANITSPHMPSLNNSVNMPPNMLSTIAPTQTTPQMMPLSMESYNATAMNPPSCFPSSLSSNSPSQTTASGFGSAGPPPFPLNLVPEATLKQLIKSLASGMPSHTGTGPRASFGSWRGTNSSNLAYAGFQSHLITPRYQPMICNTQTRRISALPAVTATPLRSKSHSDGTKNVSNQKDTAARNRMLLESQARVAAYPAYATQSLRAWNFAQ